MERCPYCQGEVDPSTRTCRWCGRVPFEDVSPTMPAPGPKLPRFCTNCGERLPEGANFCGTCGQPAIQEGLTTQTLFEGRTLPGNAPGAAPQPGRGLAAAGSERGPLTPPGEGGPPLQFIPGGLRPPAGTGPADQRARPEERKGMSSRGLFSLLLIALAILTLVSAYLITQARSNQPERAPTAPPVVNPTPTPTAPTIPTDTAQPTALPADTPTSGPAPTDTPAPAPTDTPAPTASPAPSGTPSPAGSPSPGESPTPGTTPTGRAHAGDYPSPLTLGRHISTIKEKGQESGTHPVRRYCWKDIRMSLWHWLAPLP